MAESAFGQRRGIRQGYRSDAASIKPRSLGALRRDGRRRGRKVPDPALETDLGKQQSMIRALAYMN